ncbi:MAG: hypothetical protein AABX11_00360 [Nanoarchaeota archaeon]
MKGDPFKNQVKSLDKQFTQRWALSKLFVKKVGNPVLVHAVHDVKVFNRILEDGKIKLPKNHNSGKKTPYLERFLGTDNCIFYSLSFVYSVVYNWKFNLIFDIDFLKNTRYYKNSIGFRSYKGIIDYLYENDKPYLDKFAKITNKTKLIMYKYYHEKFEGKVRKMFEFWKVEKELYNFILEYPHKKKLFKIIKSFKKNLFMRYPYSKRDVLKYYLTSKSPEIISNVENDLLKNPYFIGFFIKGKIDRKTRDILKSKYSDKLLFDGKKFIKVGSMDINR